MLFIMIINKTKEVHIQNDKIFAILYVLYACVSESYNYSEFVQPVEGCFPFHQAVIKPDTPFFITCA